jgi:hypothetical protein
VSTPVRSAAARGVLELSSSKGHPMSDNASYASSDDLRRDAGDPNRDRADLADLPPTEVDEVAVDAHLAEGDSDDDHDDYTAAQ